MAEYIEREATCKDCLHDGVCYMQEVCNDIEQQLRDFGCDNFKDKSDVVEVRHGAWIPYDGDSWKCSICGEENCYAVTLIANRKFTEKYCFSCGAKMDGKEVEG